MLRLVPVSIPILLGLTLATAADAGGPDCVAPPIAIRLLAGGKKEVGVATVWNDRTTVYVEYAMGPGWTLTEGEVAVATSVESLPRAPAQFVHAMRQRPGTASHRFAVDMKSALDNTDRPPRLYVSTHAVAASGDAAAQQSWGEGVAIADDAPATYVVYQPKACGAPD